MKNAAQSPRKCRGCLEKEVTRGNMKYCSYVCRYNDYLRRAKLARAQHQAFFHPRPSLLCANCRGPIKAGRRRVFCSDACYKGNQLEKMKIYAAELREKNPTPTKLCCLCLPAKSVPSNQQDFCSDECRKLAKQMGWSAKELRKLSLTDEEKQRYALRPSPPT